MAKGLTSAQLRYIIAVAELIEKKPAKVRCIDIAARLGVARASACRMLSSLVEEDILAQDVRKGLSFTEKGAAVAEKHVEAYRRLAGFFKEEFSLSDFDAGECAMSLLSTLPEGLSETLCAHIAQRPA